MKNTREHYALLNHFDKLRAGSATASKLGHYLQFVHYCVIRRWFSSALPLADLIIDAIIGYSLRGVPQSQVADLIRQANESAAPILSLDVPSGIDATSGEAFVPHIRAEATLTLALPKLGLLSEPAKSSVGELYLADISVPPQLYAHLGLEVGPIFAKQDIIQI